MDRKEIQQYNNITILAISSERMRKSGSATWEAICDCGKILIVDPYKVANNIRKSCGCATVANNKDWVGQKYNKLTFVAPTNRPKIGKNRKIIWECLCDCGNTTYVTPCSVSSGNTKSCGCHKLESIKKLGHLNTWSRMYNPIMSTARSVWRPYQDGCDFETFLSLSQKPCQYCNRDPHRTYNVSSKNSRHSYTSEYQKREGNFTYNGLDRVDSSRGHEIDNIVPCCYDCNKAKSALSKEEFIHLVELIYANTRKA